MEIAIISTREVIYDASLLKIGKIKVDKILHFFAGTIIALSCFLARLDLIATQLGFFLALLIKLIIYFFN